jgi:hypothetical protein
VDCRVWNRRCDERSALASVDSVHERGDGAGPGSGRGSSPHPEVVRDTSDSPFDEADYRRRRPELRVGDQFRLDEFNDLTARLERAAPRREDVLHPFHVRPVRQKEEVGIASSEHVDRRLVGTSGLAALVRQEAEGWKPPCERPRDWIDVALRNVTEPPHTGAATRLGVASAQGVRRYPGGSASFVCARNGETPGSSET